MNRFSLLVTTLTLLVAAAGSAAAAATPGAAGATGVGPSSSRSITLSPAVVPLRGAFGQSVSQALTLENGSDRELAFALEAQDVVVRDGARRFVPAGALPASIAATAVFEPREVRIPPSGKATVLLTLTLPHGVQHRGVVALFRGITPLPSGGRQALLSLGTLFTFTVSDRLSLAAASFEATPPSASANARLASTLVNDGEEPIEARGMAVILDGAGAMVGKAPFPLRRLLPGERTTVATDYPGELGAGRYRAVVTFDVAGRAVTSSEALVVP